MTSAESVTSRPPRAAVRPTTTVLHGETLVDEYRWLRDGDDPEVAAYVAAENAYADAAMATMRALEDELYNEMLARLDETAVSAPSTLGGYIYYYRSERDRPYPIYCRKRDAPGAAEEVYFDPNLLAGDADQFDLGAMSLSGDQRLLAFSYDSTGDESFTLAVMDLASGAVLGERTEGTFGQVAWASDNRTLFYVALDDGGRPWQVRRHVVGATGSEAAVVFEEHDPAFHLSVAASTTKAFIFLTAESLSCSETWFLPSADPTGEFTLVAPRTTGVEYDVDDAGDRFLVTIDDATGGRSLMEAPHGESARDAWVALDIDAALAVDFVEVFRGHYAVHGRRDGADAIVIYDREARTGHHVDFPEAAFALGAVLAPAYDTTVVTFHYSSLVTPTMLYGYDMDRRTLTVLRQLDVAGYDPAAYRVGRIAATARDGVVVPITVAYRTDRMARDGTNPCRLEGYGAYGETLDADFVPERISLLDRGVVIAMAHVRGGGELGREWHDGGRRLNKMNSFTDFIACAEHLVANGYTSPRGLAATGTSAGGLLVAACANMRPDLFRAVVADVPFVDLVSTLLDPALALSETEFDEWGDPREPESYRYLRAYSPYDGVREQPYPAMLVLGARHDARVPFWEPLKWVARLRARKTNDEPLLLSIGHGGHGLVSGRLGYLRQQARTDAFLLSRWFP